MTHGLPDTTRILVVTKTNLARAEDLGKDIRAYLAGRGVDVSVMPHEPGRLDLDGARPGAVVVLGGDGTFLSVAREAVPRNIPLLGVNLGRVGFLAEIDPEAWRPALDRLLSGQVRTEERLALSWRIKRGEGPDGPAGIAVNDLVAGRGSMARLVKLAIEVQGECIRGMRADGIVVSTPTGSTAYSVSAGGPLVHPTVPCLIVVPICPFRSIMRSLVLPVACGLTVVVEDRQPDVYLTVDGQEQVRLHPGDRIEVAAAAHPLRLLRTGEGSFFCNLAAKGFVGEVK